MALHETAHLLNHLFSTATGVRFPVWFEEGTATYFQMFVPGMAEPEVNLAALTIVIGAIEAGDGMTSEALRSVPYAKFYSYEYAWGWALVHYLRHFDRRTSVPGRVSRFVACSRNVADRIERPLIRELYSAAVGLAGAITGCHGCGMGGGYKHEGCAQKQGSNPNRIGHVFTPRWWSLRTRVPD